MINHWKKTKDNFCLMCGTYHAGDKCPDSAFANLVCECGSTIVLPNDTLFAIANIQCGNCGKTGEWKIKDENPSH